MLKDQLAGAIGTAVVMTIYSIQTTSYTTTLASQQVVHEKIGQLSSILSTNDAYLVMFIIAIVGLVVACFMPRKLKTP